MKEMASKWSIKLPVRQSHSSKPSGVFQRMRGDHSLFHNFQGKNVRISDSDLKSFVAALEAMKNACLQQQLKEHKAQEAHVEGDNIQDALSDLYAYQKALQSDERSTDCCFACVA